MTFRWITILCIGFSLISCDTKSENKITEKTDPIPIPGAYQFDQYVPDLIGKKVGLVVNHTSLVNQTHLVDTLLNLGVTIEAIFSPEHGFKGKADAGATIEDQDTEYDFRVESLYGSTKKPTIEMMRNIDIMVFDMQDVGARFYTYISTGHYVMEACVENNIPMIILDRPNPNGSYIDGPVLEQEFKSFVGMHPIPVVPGLTIGELAKMILGEQWIEGSLDLTIIPISNYSHRTPYSLPVRPSPNLPNDLAIALYPSLCFFEGTKVSIGRGTDTPFQIYGHPNLQGTFEFTPRPSFGAADPRLNGELCIGVSYIGKTPEYELDLDPIIDTYAQFKEQDLEFFNGYFNTLAGTSKLREQIENGMTESEIKATWQPKLNEYKELRKKYLLYTD